MRYKLPHVLRIFLDNSCDKFSFLFKLSDKTLKFVNTYKPIGLRIVFLPY